MSTASLWCSHPRYRGRTSRDAIRWRRLFASAEPVGAIADSSLITKELVAAKDWDGIAGKVAQRIAWIRDILLDTVMPPPLDSVAQGIMHHLVLTKPDVPGPVPSAGIDLVLR